MIWRRFRFDEGIYIHALGIYWESRGSETPHSGAHFATRGGSCGVRSHGIAGLLAAAAVFAGAGAADDEPKSFWFTERRAVAVAAGAPAAGCAGPEAGRARIRHVVPVSRYGHGCRQAGAAVLRRVSRRDGAGGAPGIEVAAPESGIYEVWVGARDPADAGTPANLFFTAFDFPWRGGPAPPGYPRRDGGGPA